MANNQRNLPRKFLVLLDRKIADRDLSRSELALELGLEPDQVESWHTDPKVLTLLECENIAQYLGIRCWSFIREAEEPESAVPPGAGIEAARPYTANGASTDSQRLADEVRGPIVEALGRPQQLVLPAESLALLNEVLAELFARRKLLSAQEINELFEDFLRGFRERFPLPLAP
ncbi:MAG: hypothetical protein GY856_24135 [bacterium]|nr:hypothetical protein [bacterium]